MLACSSLTQTRLRIDTRLRRIAGYAPSDRQLVAAPPEYDDEVLCRAVPLHDRHGNALEVRVTYEVSSGCIHALALHAAYWVVNHTGIPLASTHLQGLQSWSSAVL